MWKSCEVLHKAQFQESGRSTSTSTLIFFHSSFKPHSLSYFHFHHVWKVSGNLRGVLQHVPRAAVGSACRAAHLFPVKQTQNSLQQITCITEHFLLFCL